MTSDDITRRLGFDPRTPGALLGRAFDCVCGRRHEVRTRLIAVGAAAPEILAAYLAEHHARARIAVFADRRTLAAGEVYAAVLRGRSPRAVFHTIPDAPGGTPHADEATAEGVRAAVGDADLLLSIGSGTINDLVKLAAHRQGRPCIACATAPSMNGYTSAIAAISERGIKRTLEARAPEAIFAAPAVLGAAPPRLRQAGLGDVLSKPVCGADWWLDHRLNGAFHCPVPGMLIADLEPRYLAAAAGIGRGESAAVAVLFEALTASGLAMVVAGSSSPASGGEHLISHYWDLLAGLGEHRAELHGRQVGVGTLTTARLFEQLLDRLEGPLDVAALAAAAPSAKEIQAVLARRLGPLADEAWRAYAPKHREGPALRDDLARLERMRAPLREELRSMLMSAARIDAALSAAGCPRSDQELGLPRGALADALRHARFIRARYTVLDLATHLGLLEGLTSSPKGARPISRISASHSGRAPTLGRNRMAKKKATKKATKKKATKKKKVAKKKPAKHKRTSKNKRK